MSSIQEKIDTFRLNCYEMAVNDANELSASIEEKINKNIKDEIEVYEQEASKKCEKKSRRLEQNYNSQIFDEQNMARHAVIDAENAIKEDLRTTVTHKIKEFVNSEAYKNFLINNINKSLTKLKINGGDIIKIGITTDDFSKYKAEIEEKFNAQAEEISNKNIGGSICVNESKNISVNNTLKTLIEENL